MPASQNLRIPVQNMSCASCVGRVDRAISGLPGVDEVNVNLAAETAQFRIDSADRLPQVVQALSHQDPVIRQAALKALGQTVSLDRLSLLIDAVVQSQKAEDAEVACVCSPPAAMESA